MTKALYGILSSTAIACIAATSLQAQERNRIEGFRDLNFGITLDQVQSSADLDFSEVHKDGSQTFKVSDEVAVLGKSYTQSLRFKDNQLTEIRLQEYEPEVLRVHCDFLYKDTVGKVQAVYGDWNGPVQNINLLGQQIASKRRDFPDTTAVLVNQVFAIQPNALGGKCWVDIIYIGPAEGGTF